MIWFGFVVVAEKTDGTVDPVLMNILQYDRSRWKWNTNLMFYTCCESLIAIEFEIHWSQDPCHSGVDEIEINHIRFQSMKVAYL